MVSIGRCAVKELPRPVWLSPEGNLTMKKQPTPHVGTTMMETPPRPALILTTGRGGEHIDLSPFVPAGIRLEQLDSDATAEDILEAAARLRANGATRIGLAGASVGGLAALEAWETELPGTMPTWACLLMLYGGVARELLTPAKLAETEGSTILYLVGEDDEPHVWRGMGLLGTRWAWTAVEEEFQWLRIHPGGHGSVLEGEAARADIRTFLAWALLGGPRPPWETWP